MKPNQLAQTNNTPAEQFDRSAVITNGELEKLLHIISSPAGYDPGIVYGLYFLFTSLQKLAENDKSNIIQNLCSDALIYLFPFTYNADQGGDRLSEIIHNAYRSADFNLDGETKQSQIFVDEEIKFIRKSEAEVAR